MDKFLMKEIITDNIVPEIKEIGFQENYADFVKDKFKLKNIKIFNLTPAQANIIKQAALSAGTDCATHRDVITGKINFSDVILTGSINQIKLIAQKLQRQPFSLKELGTELEQFANMSKTSKTRIMGILNITDNSFSDGGLYNDYESAIKHLNELVSDGADIIDIGAESTKPYSNPVSAKNQIEKIIPVLEYIKNKNIDVKISVDTRNSEVAKEVLKYDVDYINDVSGLNFDDNMAFVIANSNAKVIIQHSPSTPDIMQNNLHYDRLMDDIYKFLNERILYALKNGIKCENILVDPGIGFGKTRENNFEIIRRIEELYGLNCPVVLGVSRKSLLNMPEATNDEKDIFTLALNTIALEKKVDIIRVHNVKLHKKLSDILNT